MDHHAAEAASDQFLGRLIRFHPDRAVTKDHPPVDPVVIKTVVEKEVERLVTVDKPVTPPIDLDALAHKIAEIVRLPLAANINALREKNPRVEQIIEVVADFYDLRRRDLLGPLRSADYVKCRHVAMYLSVELAGLSFPVIGRLFNRDHTTVMHAVRKIKDHITTDARLRDEIDIINLRLLGKMDNA